MASYTAGSREAGRAPLPVDTVRETGEAWWLQPLLTVLALGTFAIYSTYRAFENVYFCYPWHVLPNAKAAESVDAATYLSPFFSPYVPIYLSIGTFAISPAFYILVFPLGFRLTCY